MATITAVKTDSVVVLAHQVATHPITIVGSAIDCRTKRAATVFLFHGYVEDTVDTNPGKFLVQVRPDTGEGTINEHWATVREFSAKGTDPDFEDMTATEPIGETVLAVASTSGFAADDLLYILNTTLADSEWARVRKITATPSIDLIDGLTVQQTATSDLYNDASIFVVSLNLDSVESFRVVWTHEGTTGANGHIKALAITYDSDLSA